MHITIYLFLIFKKNRHFAFGKTVMMVFNPNCHFAFGKTVLMVLKKYMIFFPKKRFYRQWLAPLLVFRFIDKIWDAYFFKHNLKFCFFTHISCQRPYHIESTSSRSITEVKQCWAWLVLGWVTAWEPQVPLTLFEFFTFERRSQKIKCQM